MQDIELPKDVKLQSLFWNTASLQKILFNIHIKTARAPPLPSIYSLYLMG